MLFSIILPLLNGERELDGFLKSLVCQQEADFELIVVDGGSTDRSIQILESLRSTATFPISIFSLPGMDVYNSMNYGIATASGDWLYFIGCDDRLYDEFVLRDVAVECRKHSSDLIYGDVLFKSNAQRYCGPSSLHQLMYACNICHQAIFYKSTLFSKVGAYNINYPIWADWDLNIRCFQHPDIKTLYLDRVIASYNDRSGVSAIEDPVYSTLLPLCNLHQKQKEIDGIKSSYAFRLGKKVFGWIDTHFASKQLNNS